MEQLDTKRSNDPTDDGNNDNSYVLFSREAHYHFRMAAIISNLPTATDMLPLDETADSICPPTTQSIRQYPIIWMRFSITISLLVHQPMA